MTSWKELICAIKNKVDDLCGKTGEFLRKVGELIKDNQQATQMKIAIKFDISLEHVKSHFSDILQHWEVGAKWTYTLITDESFKK